MAEKDDPAKDEKPKPAGGGVLSIAVLGAVCAASAFGVVFFFAPSAPAATAECAGPVQTVSQEEALADEPVDYVELEEMLVTIGNTHACAHATRIDTHAHTHTHARACLRAQDTRTRTHARTRRQTRGALTRREVGRGSRNAGRVARKLEHRPI